MLKVSIRIFIYIAVIFPAIVKGQGILYNVLEEEGANTYIGNIIRDSNLQNHYGSAVLGDLRFRIQQVCSFCPDCFTIGQSTGDVTTAKPIDRDAICGNGMDCICPLGISVEPTDYYRLIKVNISILDINDNAPDIIVNALAQSGDIEVMENSPRLTFIAHITVSDRDSGVNGQFRCSLESVHFSLQVLFPGSYKMVTSALIDREKQDEFSVNIVCVDSGTPLQASSKLVLVKVLDANDNAPRFDPETYVARVRENNNIGMRIARVSASDEDQEDNAVIRYSIRGFNNNHGDLLHIDGNLGIITANVVFDHERQDRFEFQIMAADMGVPSRTSTATLSVIVGDMNDTPPSFSQPSYAFGVFENQPIGTEVGTVRAFDSDSPPHNNVIYMIDDPQNDYHAFNVSSETGIIRTREILDRETQSVYLFAVIARNEGMSKTASADVAIYVADVNDMRPFVIFPNVVNNTVRVSSTARPGGHVTQIVALDDDIGANAVLRYHIVTGNEGGLFRINQTRGRVVVNQSLSSVAGITISLAIRVQDMGSPSLSTMAVLNIYVNQ